MRGWWIDLGLVTCFGWFWRCDFRYVGWAIRHLWARCGGIWGIEREVWVGLMGLTGLGRMVSGSSGLRFGLGPLGE